MLQTQECHYSGINQRVERENCMNQTYILYNPLSGNGSGRENADALEILYNDPVYLDITQIKDFESFFSKLDLSDDVVLCGGDGTLNRFANDTKNLSIPNPIYYFASGTGNDFLRDLNISPIVPPNFRVNDYLRNLPKVTVHGQERLFLNNVGFGVDGYCCEEGDKLREKYRKAGKEKDVNYTMIAAKGLMFHFQPRNAVITIDGVPHRFERVWIAPTMHGRYYGGGMMAAPEQDRLDPDKLLSVMVLHGAGRLKALSMFPSIFNGKHIRHKKYVTILTGQEIIVEFDRPTPLQIDGETVLDVESYEVKSSIRTLSQKSTVCTN